MAGKDCGKACFSIAIFVFFPTVRNQVKPLYCHEWTGFCKDETIEYSVEKNAKDQEKTDITKHQSGKTLWDWLQLFAIPALLVILGYQLQRRDQKRAGEQADLERDIASANLREKVREEALGIYLDRISELLLKENLKKSTDKDPVRDIAITRTLTILERLEDDDKRKTTVIRFLQEAEVLPIIAKRLNRDDLTRAKCSGANLSQFDLSGADLGGADLSQFDLSQFDLSGANLTQANLSGANLIGANLSKAYLSRANLSGANLIGANLSGADLIGANLSKADLWGAMNFIPQQIKSACYWEEAAYTEVEWDGVSWVIEDKQANQQKIEEFKQDKDSDPKEPVDCSRWK